MNLKEMVEHMLKMYPATRGDDRKLTVEIWQRWFDKYIVQDFMPYVELDNISKLPSQETIGRWRRKFQEGGLYLPADESITKKRRAHSKTWKKELGYPTQEAVVVIKVEERAAESHINTINGKLF